MVEQAASEGERDGDDAAAETIDAIREELDTVYGQIVELGGDIDVQLADYDYTAVQQTIESFAALISGHEVDGVDELADLCARTAATDPQSPAPIAEMPRLTKSDLPAVAELGDNDDEDFVDSLRDRESRCARHIRRLFDHAEKAWEEAVDAAGAGNAKAAEAAVARLRAVPDELTSAYSLWETCLVDLYNDSPSHLSAAGDMVSGMAGWLGRQG